MKDWICFFFGHKYKTVQELTSWSRRLCCTRCRKSFAMNDDCRAVLDWDADFHRLYERMGIPIVYKDWEFNMCTKIDPPNKLKEAVDHIIKYSDSEVLEEFRGISAVTAMYGGRRFSGRMVRNHLELWGFNDLTKWFYQHGVFHADDMSCVVFKALHCKLNEKPFDIEEMADYFDRWWTCHYGDEHHPRRCIIQNLKRDGYNVKEWLIG